MGTGSAFEIIEKKKHCMSTFKPHPQHHLNCASNNKTWNKQAKQTSATFLAFPVVFGCACGAAPTTFQLEQHNTRPQNTTIKKIRRKQTIKSNIFRKRNDHQINQISQTWNRKWSQCDPENHPNNKSQKGTLMPPKMFPK